MRIERFGPPEELRLHHVPVPVPGPDEVLIRVAYCGVCRHDLLTRAGAFPRAQVPVTLGHQVSGHVDAVGTHVDSLSVGQRVMTMIFTGCGQCPACRGGAESVCQEQTPRFLGEDFDGGYAEYVAVKARTVTVVPDDVGLPEAAILTCTFGTAFHAIVGRGNVQPGQSVVVTGASGGVGSHALQIVRALGATGIGVVSSDAGEKVAREAGAHHVIVDKDRKFAGTVKGHLGSGADVVIDVVGTPTLRESLHAVRSGGTVVVVGNVEGREASIPPAYLILKEIALVGTKSCTTEEMRQVLALIAEGRITPRVSGVVPLEEVAALHRSMEEHGGNGRVVLEVHGGQ
jgi:D-arabinose 1-dehydrogenase-like Zn-dependent alcohol dehydrogenase